ncbi:hypothetical protein [Spirulina sp. 06S082]|uniref:hypothetical protein n=1 Tax=Spirulina sp. 06S082 TaxID=3110248 RepID=UPI002B1EA80A|nr:hypothetical protein [Spirulina sp. 06S082]MEA5469944.1 hypothetical protein [Spirulina sp. 06S082]
MQIVAIKRGNVLELSEVLDIPDGQKVMIEIAGLPARSDESSGFAAIQTRSPLSEEERLERLMDLFGVWKDDEELDEIFAEIDRDRHQQFGRDIDSLDD